MGIFSLFKGKKVENDKEESYVFSEQDRTISLERRRVNAELKKTQQEIQIAEAKCRLQELQDTLSEYNEDDDDEEAPSDFESALAPHMDKLVPALVNFLNGKANVQTPSPQSTVSTLSVEKINLTKEQIEAYYQKNKPYIKIAKKMTDEQLKERLLSIEPKLSESSLNDIIARVRT